MASPLAGMILRPPTCSRPEPQSDQSSAGPVSTPASDNPASVAGGSAQIRPVSLARDPREVVAQRGPEQLRAVDPETLSALLGGRRLIVVHPEAEHWHTEMLARMTQQTPLGMRVGPERTERRRYDVPNVHRVAPPGSTVCRAVARRGVSR